MVLKCEYIFFYRSIYRPPSTNEELFIDNLNRIVDFYSSNYDNVLILGDFNMDTSNKLLIPFLESQQLYSLNKNPTCFKSVNGNCIDLLLTNKNRSFKHTNVFETGMSDHHLMIYTMFRTTFDKGAPNIIKYRSYRKFDKDTFIRDLHGNLSNISDYNQFEGIFSNTLNIHAPCKQRFLRANNKPFMNKTLKKEISIRSRLRNIANKTGEENDIEKYKKQRNYVSSLNKKTQKEYFKDLDPNNITTSKSFYQNFKPFFSSKYTHSEKIILVENEQILSDETSVAECLNDYITNVTDKLDIKEWPTNASTDSIEDPILKSISKYSNHPSILKINTNFKETSKLNFRKILPEEIMNEIKKLKMNKGISGDIPTKFVKEFSQSYINPLTDCYNNSIDNHVFPDLLKLNEFTPVFKKGDKTDKENYRPISVPKPMAKILERMLSKQLNEFINDKFSPLLCAFRKGHNTQHALLNLLENWREKIDKKEIIGVILCDLSKAFDTLPHDLLIAKLYAYGIDYDSLKLIHSYLFKRKQRCKVGSSYSTWSEIMKGVPQGSVLGPLLFNIFINDFFFFIKESSTCNFADDNSLYANGKSICEVAYKLENDLQNALIWFRSNGMVVNPKKFQLMFLGTRSKTKICLEIGGNKIISSTFVTLLGIKIDWKLNFNLHVNGICNTANNKAKALTRLRFKLNQSQKRCLYYCYVMSSFGYCPVTWMFCGKVSNEKINKVQRKALRAVYNDYSSSFEALLNKGNHLPVHEMNKRSLLIEVFKCLNNLNPVFLSDIFKHKCLSQNLRTSNLLILPKTNTVTGLKSFSFRGSMIWNNIPDILKNCANSSQFKLKLKSQKAIKCSCNICS